MHSFQVGCEWFSQSQDDDIPLLLTGREWYLSGIGGWRHSAVAHRMWAALRRNWAHRAEPLPF
nr:hypothetical protein [Evansella caseinilytica]